MILKSFWVKMQLEILLALTKLLSYTAFKHKQDLVRIDLPTYISHDDYIQASIWDKLVEALNYF